MAYALKIFTRLEELDSLRIFWLAFTKDREGPIWMDADLEYFKFQISEGILDGDPLVFALYDDQKPVLIACGKIDTVNISPYLGAYFRLGFIKSKKKCYYIFPYAILGNLNSEETVRNFIKSIIPLLKKNNVDYVHFSLIPEESDIAKYLLKFPNVLMKDHVPSFEDHYILKIPEDFETFLSTRNTNSRQKFRRLIRRLENDSTKNLVFKIFTDEKDMELFFLHAEQIAQKSQLRALNVGFRATPVELKKKKWLAANGYFRGYILYLNDTPSSFLIGINYNRNFYLEYTAIRIEYEKYQLGTYLYLKIIDDIIKTGFADRIDYTHGSQLYKKILSSANIKDIRIKLYIPKISNIFFITNVTFNTLLNNWSRSLLKKMGLYDKLRRAVRIMFKKKIKGEAETKFQNEYERPGNDI
jgi:hypothetical protein